MLNIFIFGFHGWALIFRLPRTLRTVAVALGPNGHGVPDDELFAFGSLDARFRPWYNKIARDYHHRGRFGIAWDDGLGMPLGIRIYNNWATYALLHRLGTRRLMRLGYSLLVVAIAAVAWLAFGPMVGIATGTLAAGSPLVVINYTHLGKPEVVWWGPALGALALGVQHPSWQTGLAWSLLAFGNVPVAVMLGLMVGPGLLILAASNATIGLFLLGCLPGVAKGLARAWQMWRSGFMGSLASEQGRLFNRGLTPTFKELIWMVPFAVAVGSASYMADEILVGSIILLGGCGLYWFNFRFIYVNDPQSFHLAFLTIGIAVAAGFTSVIGLVVSLAAAYHHPRFCRQPGTPPLIPEERRWARWARVPREVIKAFPAITPVANQIPEPLDAFLRAIPDNTRVLAESDGDPRSGSLFRPFWTWTEEILPARGVDVVNEIYTRLVEPKLVDQYLVRFNAVEMTAEEMRHLSAALGVDHVVTYTESMTTPLTNAGFTRVCTVDLEPLLAFRSLLRVPPAKLTLFRALRAAGPVEPARRVTYERSTLSFPVTAGSTYTIRYRALQGYSASVAGEPVQLTTTMPFTDCPLTFMRVVPHRTGELILHFNSSATSASAARLMDPTANGAVKGNESATE